MSAEFKRSEVTWCQRHNESQIYICQQNQIGLAKTARAIGFVVLGHDGLVIILLILATLVLATKCPCIIQRHQNLECIKNHPKAVIRVLICVRALLALSWICIGIFFVYAESVADQLFQAKCVPPLISSSESLTKKGWSDWFNTIIIFT